MTVVVRSFGDRAVLVEPAGPVQESDRAAILAWISSVCRAARALWPEAEVTPGMASVLVAFADPIGSPDPWADALHTALAAADSRPEAPIPSAAHRVEVRYDGPDLAAVAAALGLSLGALVDRHTGTTWTVAAIGFAPGFAYLTCTDEVFDHIPRLAEPRRRVPAGAVAVAAGMCAIYPSASPGGWQLLGSSGLAMFAADRVPPALFAVGDTVQFVAQP